MFNVLNLRKYVTFQNKDNFGDFEAILFTFLFY